MIVYNSHRNNREGEKMKLSTLGRYGARAMVDLAVHQDESPVLLKDIAARQDVSEKYLEHIFAGLRKAGLVKSLRGSKGGYYLAKKPDEITLFDIINALEGSLAIVHCVEDPSRCKRVKNCVTRDVWSQLSDAFQNILASVTLEDMAEKQKKPTVNAMYYI